MSTAPAPDLERMNDIVVDPLDDDVHVWLLRQPEGVSSPRLQEACSALLTTDELDRASRFHFARHAREYIANRARLRIVLSRYLDVDPASLRFEYNAFGKPGLSSIYGKISFNLSHTEGIAMVAVSRRGSIGVDVEKIVPQSDWLDLARSYFSKAELDDLSQMDPIEGQASFYRCWTRKEAFLKALGDGLSRPLSEFTVSSGRLTAEVIDCSWDSSAPAAWQLFSLEVGTSYAATLAYGREHSRLLHSPKVFSWSYSL